MKFDKLTEAYLKVVNEASYHQDAIEQDISNSNTNIAEQIYNYKKVINAAKIMEDFYSTLAKTPKPKERALYTTLQREMKNVMVGLENLISKNKS